VPDSRVAGSLAVVIVLALLAGPAGCRRDGGVAGIVGGPVASAGLPGATPVPPEAPATTAPPGSIGPSPSTTAPGAASPTTAPGSQPGPTAAPRPAVLRLGGNDLGVTEVGAPYRDAVAAVAGVLGPPVADPATDSACIGAEQEVSWGRSAWPGAAAGCRAG